MPSIIIIVAMFALLWVLMIRPQRAKQRQQQRMLEAIAIGDEILTVGGLYGIVQEIDEDEDLVVEIAESIHVRIARRAVAAVVKPDEVEDAEIEEDLDGDEEDPVPVLAGDAGVEPEHVPADKRAVGVADAPAAPSRPGPDHR